MRVSARLKMEKDIFLDKLIFLKWSILDLIITPSVYHENYTANNNRMEGTHP